MNNITLFIILIGVSSDTLLTGCLLGTVSSNRLELKKLIIVALLLLFQVAIFYVGYKFGFFLTGHLKNRAALMGGLVLMALGVKMTAEWTLNFPARESINIYNVSLLMMGTAVYIFATGNVFGLLQTNNQSLLSFLPVFLLLFIVTGRILTNNRNYLNWLHRTCSLLIITGAAILLIQNL